MKLHLPKGLRNAVMACLAVAGGFATTVGTGIITGGALTIAFATSQAQADMTIAAGTTKKLTGRGETGTVTVAGGGTLELAGGDCLGWWNGTRVENLFVGDGTETATVVVSARQTFSTNLELRGNAVIEAADDTIIDPSKDGYDAGSAPSFDCYYPAGTISATGTGNVIGINIFGRDSTPNPVNISVASGGDLTITGSIRIRTQGIGIAKNGKGLLTISSNHNYLHKGYTNNGGTTVIGGAFAVDTGVYVNAGIMQVTSGGTLTLGNTITVAGSAMFENLGTVTVNTNTFAPDLVFSNESDGVKAAISYEIYSGEGTIIGLDSVKVGDTTLAVVDGRAGEKQNATAIEGVKVEGSTITMSNGSLSTNIVVESGLTLKQTANDQMGANYVSNTSRTITVKKDATLDNSGKDAYYHVVLEEGATLANSVGDVGTTNRNLPVLDLKGDASVSSDYRFGMLGSEYAKTYLNLNGNTLTKEGGGVFHLHKTEVDSGVINVKAGKLEWLEGTVMLEETEIIVGSGATLDAKIDANRSLHALTGNGGKVIVAEGQTLTVSEISGTSLTREGNGTLAISTILTPANLTITGGVVGNNVQKIGAGNLTIDSLTMNATGSLVMNHDGAFTINTLNIAEGLTFVYDDTAGANMLAVNLGSEAHKYTLDLKGVDSSKLATGIDLGLIYTGDVAALKTAMELVADVQLIKGAGDRLTFKWAASAEVLAAWDKNWGFYGLMYAPGTIQTGEVGATPYQVYGNDTYKVTGGYAIKLTNSTVDGAIVTGGLHSDISTGGGTVEANTWILATGGSYQAIVGGNCANNWGSGAPSHFIGDSHILIDGATVGTIIGGNYKDGQDATFTGDSYISVMSGNVTGTIIGAGMVTHNATTSHNGDTNIFIYTPLAEGTTKLHGDPTDGVYGGFVWANNISGGQTLNGDTNIVVDLTGNTSTDDFAKRIIGGNYNQSGSSDSPYTQTITGSTNVTMDLGKHTATQTIVGGSELQMGYAVENENNVTINSGNYAGRIAAGSWLTGWEDGSGRATATTKKTNLVINGGTFERYIVGGHVIGNNGQTASLDEANVTIKGGETTETEAFIASAGHIIKGGNMTVGAVNVDISGGKFAGSVIGGVWDDTANENFSKVTVGDINMKLTGGTYNGWVTGGGYMMGSGGMTNAEYGDITITVDGAELASNLYGGGRLDRDFCSLTQGNIVINLIDGSLSGNLYAGGNQQVGMDVTTRMTAESTTVAISDEFQLSDGIKVSGYAYIHSELTDQAQWSTVGKSTLKFTGAAAQDRSNVAISHFDEIVVEQAAATVTMGSFSGSSFSKTGAGALVLSKGGDTDGASVASGISVKEGSLKLTDATNAYDVGGIQVAKDAKLDIGSGATLLSDADTSLTLDAGAILAATRGGEGLGVDTLTVGGAFTIELDSAIKSGDCITLVTGLTSITGIDFTDSIAAAADYLSKVTSGGVDMKLDRLQLEYVDGNLYLATAPGTDLTWCGNDGNWSNADTDKVWYDPAWNETPPTPVEYTPGADAVTFDSTAAGTVTVTEAVVTGDMTVTGGDYTFANGGGSLVVEDTLSVTGGKADLSALGTVKAKNVSNAATLVAGTLELTGGKLTQSAGSLAATAVTGTGNVAISGGMVNIGSVSNTGSVEVTKAIIVGDTNGWTATDTTSVTVGDATIGTADTTGSVALSGADSAAVNVNGMITVNAGSSLELSGNVNLVLGKTDKIIDIDTSQSTYDDGLNTGTQSGNGFITALTIYSFTSGEGEVTADSVNWSIDGAAVDASIASWENDSLAIREKKDYSSYYVRTGHNDTEDKNDDAVVYLKDINTAITNVGSGDITTTKDNTTTIMLDGGKLVVDGDLGHLDIRTNKGVVVGQDTTSVLELTEGTTVLAAPSVVVEDVAPATLDDSDAGKLIVTVGTEVILTGSGTYDMRDLGTYALPSGVKLDAAENGWAGTIQLGDIDKADTAVDVSALGDADSTVKANSITAKSLNAETVGTLISADDVTLAGSATSTVNDLEVGGALSLRDGASLEAKKLEVTGVTTVDGASLSADSAELSNLTMNKGAQVTTTGALTLGGDLTFNALGADTTVTVGELNLTTDTDTLSVMLKSQMIQDIADNAADISQPLVTLMTVTSGSDAKISLNGGANIVDNYAGKYDYAINWAPSASPDAPTGTDLQLTAQANPNYMKEKYNNASPNGLAGAAIMDSAFAGGTITDGGELQKILDGVDNNVITDKDLASIAGSSTAALGMALAGDVERQLRAIRNRTTTMGVDQCVVNEGMPYFNAWVNAEGNLSELDQDGTYAGYTLESWGGTVGFDVDVNPSLTLGLAVTAMYGDLTVDGPDMLDGDMDTYYVSAFARYASRAWTHTFVGTVGMMDGSYERTVSHANGSYKTEGDTEGMAFALMYEVGRVYAFHEDSSACWQPVFNVAYRHTAVDGYKESGPDAALNVDDQTLDTITFGAGARLQAVVGENLYNRTSVLELRALAKLDVGDRSSEADVAFIGGGRAATVESAELGAFGVELGAGLSIPMGDEDSGSLFFDVSAELRSGYSNVNGTVGYRINF